MIFSEWDQEKRKKSDELFKRGKIRHVLNSKQREFYDLVKSKHPANREFFLYSSRKVGKTFMLCLIALEHCWANPNQIVRHVFPTYKLAKETVFAIMGELSAIIPRELMPELRRSEGVWYFANGSQYRLGGADPGSIDNNRGPYCTMILGDEMCFWDAKVYVDLLKSALKPQMTNVKNPICIYASTPPYSPDHPSLIETMPKIQAAGCYMHATIYDNPMLTPEAIALIVEEHGGVDSNSFRREYLAEMVVDVTKRAVPEFDKLKHVVTEGPPSIDDFGNQVDYNGYRVADYGVGEQDLTGLLAGIFDHNGQVVYIMKEDLLYKPVIDTFVDSWYKVEVALEKCVEVTSVIDAFEQMKNTLRRQEGLDFINPRKGKVTDQVAFVRQCFESGKIKIHKDCENLIRQLELGMWKDNDKEFARSDALGHLDLLVCLIYMVRRIDWRKRPGIIEHEDFNIRLGAANDSTQKSTQTLQLRQRDRFRKLTSRQPL